MLLWIAEGVAPEQLEELGFGFLADVAKSPTPENLDVARQLGVKQAVHRNGGATFGRRSLRGYVPSRNLIELGDVSQRYWPGLALSDEAREFMMSWASRPGCARIEMNVKAAEVDVAQARLASYEW